MKRAVATPCLVATLALASNAAAHSTGQHAPVAEKWSLTATIIEATTGDWPCSHAASSVEAACRYSRAIVVERGEMGTVLLGGAKLWMAGEKAAGSPPDLHEWAVIAFDPSVMLEQRTALLTIVHALYPLQWMAITVGNPTAVEWSESADAASARLAEGSVAELLLERRVAPRTLPAADSLRYGTSGKITRSTELSSVQQAYRVGPKPFAEGPASGFVLTLELTGESRRE